MSCQLLGKALGLPVIPPEMRNQISYQYERLAAPATGRVDRHLAPPEMVHNMLRKFTARRAAGGACQW